MTRRPRGSAGQRGSATVLATGFAGLLAVAGLAAAVVGGLVVNTRRVESAADLAALAGAAAAQAGGPGCEAAALAAGRNGARLDGCETAAGSVQVTVSRGARVPLLGEVRLRSRARAGPDKAG